MQTLHFTLSSAAAPQRDDDIICGVVGSGNLEVLITRHDAPECTMTVHTSAEGFDKVWQAVLDDFSQRYAVGGLNFEINDMGATPAVVSLRLSQAMTMRQGETS
ncbi:MULTISPECIES: malonate decarboxylase acyl carrier protein [Moraxella]|uniref:Malonate decarboxylase acyl carrier protein n=1 Tax=Moraxella catarrhalis TaxID=480 RepID=A0A7Z0UZY9_MORCA|nr:malonate decarboxylase acyl carrier protein [Moraxella catarrhalis]OAV01590.1 Malonate decarboxylase delta subunit [Moraxella catarrhalis]STY82676.1 Malonate decarboxylase subunit delta [Moraxella catarrhalis]